MTAVAMGRKLALVIAVEKYAYLLNGGTIGNAQAIAAHESLRTTKLFHRTTDEITLDEIERIGI